MKKFLLIFFNLFISSNWMILLVFVLFLLPFVKISYYLKFADPLSSLILYILFFPVFVIIFKISIFRIIYRFKKQLPYFGNFLEKIIYDINYRRKILKFTNISDISFVFINAVLLNIYSLAKDISSSFAGEFFRSLLIFIFWGGGVTICYKSFLIGKKKLTESPNREIDKRDDRQVCD